MPRKETVLSVFVASPSDVTEERDKLEEVIRELNLSWSKNLGLRLELNRWETHTMPGRGLDAQDVINGQIDDYDVFIGLMWHRFGTPTGRYGSGTVEEFEIAKEKIEDPHKNIMFYFRSSPPTTMDEIDGDQLALVQKFRKSLGDEGTYYWPYRDTSAFEKFIRIHLTTLVQKWKINDEKSTNLSIARPLEDHPTKPLEEEIDDIEPGIFDILDEVEDKMQNSQDSLERSASYLSELSVKLNQHTDSINTISNGSQANTKEERRKLRRVISSTSSDMDQFSERFEAEIPIFRNNFNESIRLSTIAIELVSDLSTDEEYKNQLSEYISQIDEFVEIINGTCESALSFRDTISSLPRLTGEINKSKRRIVSAIDLFMVEMRSGANLAKEAASIFNK
ncbi:DUF4062 domain-containing protein [Hoeflea sp. AS60]|uniref:DUF4062 domain-containing protein n=1 Tax=Hoeflea sp. AS60 TaxID=3135780 RepID=UPI00317DAC43